MKRQKKVLIIAVYLIHIIAVFYLGYSAGKSEKNAAESNSVVMEDTAKDATEENEMKDPTYVSGMLASYQYVDREIKLDFFYGLDDTSTYEQIVDEIGEPNGQFGSGIVYLYYEISSGLYMSISFTNNDTVALIRLCTQEEILDVIYPR